MPYGPVPIPPEIRFWSKVNKNGPIPTYRPDLGPCWLWIAFIDGGGYGKFTLEHNYKIYAHRFSYEITYGPIATDKEIDHLCRVRHCVNPTHLEAVTHYENTLRGEGPLLLMIGNEKWRQTLALRTHCSKGHLRTEENTYRWKEKHYCKVCRDTNIAKHCGQVKQ